MNWSTYFDVINASREGDSHVFEVAIRPDCAVYRGHFPGNPISPGVCNIGMIKRLAERVAGRKLNFTVIKQCRLTGLVTPKSTPELKVVLEMDSQNIHAEIRDDVKSYMELKCEFVYA